MARQFAFYGRVSTEDQQDPESSRGWQLARARALIGPHDGVVVAEYFDIGLSRSLPWKRRPQAALLLGSFRDPARGFDAVVIGEPARAFYGNQFGLTFPVFEHYDVQLWVPEVGGRVDPGSDAHELVMAMYGGMSKGERNRIKIRVRSSMAAQASTQGRYLGGRPPYGYRLADAGPHPNPGKAATGQRAHRLEVDPVAAPVVQRIFEEFVGGRGVSAIANRLNRDEIACPSAHDRARNRHRSGTAWVGAAVLAIVRNPRYTGHEVWNKQRKDEVLIDVEDVALGHETRMRWNSREEWIFSQELAHPALISKDTFDQAAALAASKGERSEHRRARSGERVYVLRGLLFCAACGRRMAGSWNNERVHYRCKLKAADAALAAAGHPASVYVREDRILGRLDDWLGDMFSPSRREATIDALYDAGDDPGTSVRRQALSETLRGCDTRLANYRAALDAGADPATVAGWMREVTAERTRTEISLRQLTADHRTSRQQIVDLVDRMTGLTTLLAEAQPQDRARLYEELGLKLTYQPGENVVQAEAVPAGHGDFSSVRGGT